jgi:hypothetical protein
VTPPATPAVLVLVAVAVAVAIEVAVAVAVSVAVPVEWLWRWRWRCDVMRGVTWPGVEICAWRGVAWRLIGR